MPVTEPEKLWAVLDQDSTVYAAAHPRACHEHINDAIDNDVQDAGKMVVREYVSLKAHNEELARLRAENERLTGALQEIANTPTTPANHDLVAVIMLAQLALRDENGG